MANALAEEISDLAVSEYEGAVLSVIARMQPVSRYQLLRSLQLSPTTTYNSSKGSLYPLVARMVGRSFVRSESPEGKSKGELLCLTSMGHRALANWILATGPEHSFTHDPLLMRLLSLADVPQRERIRWVAAAKAALLTKRDEVRAHRNARDSPYGDIVQGAAVAMIEAKLEWLDRLLIKLVDESDSAGASLEPTPEV